MQGLIRSENLDLFLAWYAFGGTERGIGLTELMTLDAAIIADFSYILRRLGELRAKHDHFQRVSKDTSGIS